MGLLYDFERLIDKYSNKVEIITQQSGQYVNGRYVAAADEVNNISGAVIPLKDEKIYQSGGTLTKSDRQLYTKEPISNDLNGVKVRYKGKTYKVEEDTDYSDYGKIYVYVLKRVDSFDRPT